ncbi:hypothetical protein P4O66_022482, partial [Electrophorus voltai]
MGVSKVAVHNTVNSYVVIGNRLVTLCGPDPSQLCMPCEPRHYTTEPMSPYCTICTQCT